MRYWVEMDFVRSGMAFTAEAGRAFIETIIFPTLDRARKLEAGKTIVAGGPVAGRIALRFVLDADSSEHADRVVSSLPLWQVAETHIIPLITFDERREHVEQLLQNVGKENR